MVRIGISAEEIDASERPAVNLVLLVDTSGSMNSGDKLQLVQATLRMLADQLREDDRVSIVTYAGSASVPLSEAKGNETTKILAAIDAMRAGGSTAGPRGFNRVRPARGGMSAMGRSRGCCSSPMVISTSVPAVKTNWCSWSSRSGAMHWSFRLWLRQSIVR